jgi:hypothetical protein
VTTTLETREESIALAHIWLRRAAQFESDNALLGAWSTSSKEYVAPFTASPRRVANRSLMVRPEAAVPKLR